MNTFLASILASVLLVGIYHCPAVVQAEGDDLVDWYAQCFFGQTNVTEMVLCLVDETDCVDRDTVETIETCVAEKGDVFATPRAVVECVQPYITCLTENAEEWIAALPPCVNETLTDLFLCGLEYNETCIDTCSDDLLPQEENPFADVDPLLLTTCKGVQDEIFTPMCQIVDCCEPCVDEFEEAARCVLHQIMMYPETRFLSNDPCIDCDYASENRRLKTPQSRRLLTDEEQSRVNNIVVGCIDNTPGLTPNARNQDELVQRGEWFTCVTQGMFDTIAQGATTQQQPTWSPTTEGTPLGTPDGTPDGTSSSSAVSRAVSKRALILAIAVLLAPVTVVLVN